MSAENGQTRILYNADCPICSREIDTYRKRAERDGLPLRFDALQDGDLDRYGVGPDDAARRLHVLQGGRVLSGMAAFRALWREMPHLAWLARATDVPGLRQASDWTYDRVLAPMLYRAHLRREARRVS